MFMIFRPFWRPLFIALCISLVVQLIGAFSPYLFGKSVDAVIHKNTHLTVVYVLLAFLLTFFQEQIAWWFKESFELKHLDDHVQRAFSIKALEKLFGFSIGQHLNEHSGVRQGIVTKGQSSLINLMYTLLYSIVPNILQIIVITTILVIFDWRIATVEICFVILYLLFAFKVNKNFFPKIEAVRKKNQSTNKSESEFYRNAPLVIAEGQEQKAIGHFSSISKSSSLFSTHTWLQYLRPYYLSRSLITIGQYAMLGLGVYLILIGEHSTGMFVTLFAWSGTIFGNLTMIVNNQRSVLSQVVEIKKFFELLEIKPDIDPNENGQIIKNLEGKIDFRNVSFAYPYRHSSTEEQDEPEEDKKEEHAIESINFTIPAGAKVGFVGASGSGKSTIVNLMRRYYDVTEGEILIDGINIKSLDLKWLRSNIGNVEQKIDLFDESIKENILFGLPIGTKISEEKLSKTVHDASLDDFITKLKDHGLDTVIGEGGIKVSGGERQRIGIARALIKDPKILIFDEATSALDSINEKLIHEAINRSAEGRTTIMIAHRLSTVMDADIIFVVSEGKIVDSGTHKELEARCKEYQDLIKNQIF